MRKLKYLTFLTCGAVDDGKSTFLGRLLYDGKFLSKDLMEKKNPNFSHFLDGLLSEREQGITIDVAYRSFTTKTHRFMAIDAPGHEQYTKNMAVAASQADVALVLIDIDKGISEQTLRHTFICSLFQIKKLVILINKMDLVSYKQSCFERTVKEFSVYCSDLKFEGLVFIPISALNGDNITKRSKNMPWFTGITVSDALNSFSSRKKSHRSNSLIPIQMVRNNEGQRLLYGRVHHGSLKLGDKIKVFPSQEINTIEKIYKDFKIQKSVSQGVNICFSLKEQMDISQGDIVCCKDFSPEYSNLFRARVFWMASYQLMGGRQFEFKFHNNQVKGCILKIKSSLNINLKSEISSKVVNRNGFGNIDLKLNNKIPFIPYDQDKVLGSFLIIDSISKDTVGVGTINYSLRRSSTIFPQNFNITSEHHAELKKQKAKVIWMTGLSASGKSTIANELEKELYAQGRHTFILDGDNIRNGLCKDLGFEESDRVENIRRISEVAKLMCNAGLIVICSFISPYNRDREAARKLIGEDDFFEIFIDTPIEECIKRDPKGLYKKALNNEIPNFTGINSIYENPISHDITIDTLKLKPIEAVKEILKYIKL